MSDHYRTIKTEAVVENKVKGSRFIGRSFIVESAEEAQTRLEEIRKIEYQATHNCYAYLVGIEEQRRVYKYSDDGEPGGTAGRPIYDVVNGSDVTNILIVVTRYFGGTKLGTGGLVRAYGDAAKDCLEKSGRKDHYLTTRFTVQIEFSFYDALMKTITHLKATQLDAVFAEAVSVKVEIRTSEAEKLEAAIIEATNGKAKIEKTTD